MVSSANNNYCLTLFDKHLEIQFPDTEKSLKLYYVWLRDHCRCSKCYNIETNQIFSNLLDIDLDIKPRNCDITSNNLNIIWKDDHQSKFSLNWVECLFKPNNHDIVLWNRNDVLKFNDTKVPLCDFFRDEDGPRRLLKSIMKYGFGFVTDVPPTAKATEMVATHLAPIKKTFFGEMWFVNEDKVHEDIAYTKSPLDAHTDNTYFSDTSGLQVFHMLSTDGLGGESILVDGFNVANILKEINPSHYDFLCNNAIESRYIEKGYHYYNIDPVIKLHPIRKTPLQIRYNMYDRAPLTLIPEENLLQFYDAYQCFGKIINSPINKLLFKLSPGSVLFFNNWRLLHGRSAYRGNRLLTGCYISNDDWISKARTLDLNII